MKKIVVVGAGHGGLIAAAKLAKDGAKVTVYEKSKREDLGHDWEDRFTFSILSRLIEKDEKDFPEGCWRYRGDCAFVSPAKRKKVVINYDDTNRQRIMWRKTLIDMLIDYAEKCGVEFSYENEVYAPLVEDNRVIGIACSTGDINCDLVIDAAGAFSPVRMNLRDDAEIESLPRRGDIFYAYRAYFKRDKSVAMPEIPFEVYMYHEGEKGLSWFNTNEDNVDMLIGRIEPLSDEKIIEQFLIFQKDHPWFNDQIEHGGKYGAIPVRRPLTLMVYNNYAAVGDSAFMTTPMNGMGIDLSLLAGELLAETVKKCNGNYSRERLWEYNRKFHTLYGGETAKNEGLKNAILSIPSEGVDFLFENDVIQSSDLAGAGRNTKLSALLGKAFRGMKKPKYFLALIKGLIRGSKAARTYKKAPEEFDIKKIRKWDKKIKKQDIQIP